MLRINKTRVQLPPVQGTWKISANSLRPQRRIGMTPDDANDLLAFGKTKANTSTTFWRHTVSSAHEYSGRLSSSTNDDRGRNSETNSVLSGTHHLRPEQEPIQQDKGPPPRNIFTSRTLPLNIPPTSDYSDLTYQRLKGWVVETPEEILRRRRLAEEILPQRGPQSIVAKKEPVFEKRKFISDKSARRRLETSKTTSNQRMRKREIVHQTAQRQIDSEERRHKFHEAISEKARIMGRGSTRLRKLKQSSREALGRNFGPKFENEVDLSLDAVEREGPQRERAQSRRWTRRRWTMLHFIKTLPKKRVMNKNDKKTNEELDDTKDTNSHSFSSGETSTRDSSVDSDTEYRIRYNKNQNYHKLYSKEVRHNCPPIESADNQIMWKKPTKVDNTLELLHKVRRKLTAAL